MDKTRTFSARGVSAQKRGLKTLRELAAEFGSTERELAGAPKAEWHHDLRTGEEVWLYSPEKVWAWYSRKRPSRFANVAGIPAEKSATGAAPAGNEGGGRSVTYLFVRAEGFYPLELADDESARRNADLNPGTLRVENALTREVVWPNKKDQP